MERDVAIWSERAQKMRKQVIDRINSDDELNRRRLLTDNAADLLHKVRSILSLDHFPNHLAIPCNNKYPSVGVCFGPKT